MPGHIALLGDSIFDNAAYTRGEPDVVTHLATLLPDGWRATLCAVDGATTRSIASQLSRVPSDATHLVLSVGGNDALQHAGLLRSPVGTAGEALALFGEHVDAFELAYRAMLATVFALRRPVVVCTVYNGALDPDEAAPARAGLALFNDAILRAAFEARAAVIELRSLCTAPEDYANPIEPSGAGGRKIAAAVTRAVGAVETPVRPSRVWA